MASAVIVLKHLTSNLHQRHNCISIDFKFGAGDYVREVTNPDKVGSGPISHQDATWGQHILPAELQPIPVNTFSRTIAQNTRSGVRKTLFGMRNV